MLSMLCFSDVLVWFGGDEFGLLLLDCNVESVCFIVICIISVVNDYYFIWEGCVYQVGVSVGIILIDDNNYQVVEVMLQVDIVCYVFKNGGWGWVMVYELQ